MSKPVPFPLKFRAELNVQKFPGPRKKVHCCRQPPEETIGLFHLRSELCRVRPQRGELRATAKNIQIRITTFGSDSVCRSADLQVGILKAVPG